MTIIYHDKHMDHYFTKEKLIDTLTKMIENLKENNSPDWGMTFDLEALVLLENKDLKGNIKQCLVCGRIPLWKDNELCPECGGKINPKIRSCETGYYYCSDECAIKHVNDNAPEGGY